MTGPTGGSQPAGAPPQNGGGGPGEQPDVPAPPPAFADVETWVTGYFLPMFRRTLGGEFRWCAEWWKHAEAVSRLTALWRAWETFRLEATTGIADWYREHLDHQLPIVLGSRGPFYKCTEDEHLESSDPRCEPAPPGWLGTGPAPQDGWPEDTWTVDGGDGPAGPAGPDSAGRERPPGHPPPHTAADDRRHIPGAGR